MKTLEKMAETRLNNKDFKMNMFNEAQRMAVNFLLPKRAEIASSDPYLFIHIVQM